MYDFVIKQLNDTEISISALTERAQHLRHLLEGHSIAFKSAKEAVAYIEAAEADGLTFSGKEFL